MGSKISSACSSDLVAETVSRTSGSINKQQLKPETLPQLLANALELTKDSKSVSEQKERALQIVHDAQEYYTIDEADLQLIDFIVRNILPKLCDILLDVANGKYNMEIGMLSSGFNRWLTWMSGVCGFDDLDN